MYKIKERFIVIRYPLAILFIHIMLGGGTLGLNVA